MWLYWNTKGRDHSLWVWHNHFFMKHCASQPIRHVYDQKHVSNSWCARVYRCGRFRKDVSSEGPPLWSSGQSSWLQIRRPGFDSRHYQKKKVVGLERGPLSFVSTITSPTSGGRSVGIVRSRTQTMEFLYACKVCYEDGFTSWRRSVLPVRYELDCNYCYKLPVSRS
jgi:hypothetical protein